MARQCTTRCSPIARRWQCTDDMLDVQEEGADKFTDREAKLCSCHLTGAPLQSPIAADYLGHLYNRQSLIEYLLAVGHDSYTDEAAQHRYAYALAPPACPDLRLSLLCSQSFFTVPSCCTDSCRVTQLPKHGPE